MEINIKKIAAVLFILPGFAPLFFALFIIIKKEHVHEQTKVQFEFQNLQTVLLAENEVIWTNKHESWINNSMFDIKSKKIVNGICTFIGLYDEDETKLGKIERDASGKSIKQEKFLSQLLEHFIAFYNPPADQYYSISLYNNFNFFALISPEHPFRKISTPPPQVYCSIL